MTRVGRDIADNILTTKGWLSNQPPCFQHQVLNRSVLERFDPREIIYRQGDPVGGIYGLVAGVVSLVTAPAGNIGKLVHIAHAGQWSGEAAFLTRKPRRIELSALTETWMMHLPLSAMDQISQDFPEAARRFALILVENTNLLIRAVHDLQLPRSDRRIASVLHRAAATDNALVPLTQAEIGIMANTSRKQVNAALKIFETRGWIRGLYRSIHVLDAKALSSFAWDDI